MGVVYRAEDTVQILDELIAMRGRSYVSPYGIASIFASLHEVDSAFEWLDRAYDEHDQTMVLVKVHPRLDPLRTDVRWGEILERMRL